MQLFLEGVGQGVMIGIIAFMGIMFTIDLIVGKEVSPMRLVYKQFKQYFN
jgi:hypothetical protein